MAPKRHQKLKDKRQNETNHKEKGSRGKGKGKAVEEVKASFVEGTATSAHTTVTDTDTKRVKAMRRLKDLRAQSSKKRVQ